MKQAELNKGNISLTLVARRTQRHGWQTYVKDLQPARNFKP